MPTATPASQFMWLTLPWIWVYFVVPFLMRSLKPGQWMARHFYLAPLGYPNMKFSILALGAAVAGISSQCAAQLHIEPSFPTRAAETRLVSQQQETVGSAFADEPAAGQEDSAYFAPTPPQAEITRDSVRASQSILSESSAESGSIDPSVPTGKPISKNITTGAPLHVLQMTPEVGMVPVCWQNTGCPTPNPIADYLRESWCSNGLWDTYPCQRARQCAHIQQQMFGHNRYTCGGCAACGVAPVHVGSVTTGGCASCAAPSHCAQALPKTTTSPELKLPASTLMTAAPTAQSPFLGEMQAGLPVIDMSQFPGTVPPAGYGQPAQLTTTPVTNRLPNGQPLLQLPSDVPSVPQEAVAPTLPSVPSLMPALPVPSATPVVASRGAVSLR